MDKKLWNKIQLIAGEWIAQQKEKLPKTPPPDVWRREMTQEKEWVYRIIQAGSIKAELKINSETGGIIDEKDGGRK
ncbi:MAG TPA: hypothetical protein EYP60_04375 [bacterium (Candidatus Stahlbacteria)]|nr:hypothetical protein [Candidatus Stahlbacteria bacterium]